MPEDFVGQDLVSTHMALVDYSSEGGSGSSGGSSLRSSPGGSPHRQFSSPLRGLEEIALAVVTSEEEASSRGVRGSSASESHSSAEGAGELHPGVASHRLDDLEGRKAKGKKTKNNTREGRRRVALRPSALENWQVPEVAAAVAASTPASFCCPITHELMRDPVIAADGHTYERVAIARWLKHHGTSPSTNLPLKHRGVIPNHSLRSAILDFAAPRSGGA